MKDAGGSDWGNGARTVDPELSEAQRLPECGCSCEASVDIEAAMCQQRSIDCLASPCLSVSWGVPACS